ncbi:hypothetical protein AVEN_25423-1, partial [Araneus ventricosus]
MCLPARLSTQMHTTIGHDASSRDTPNVLMKATNSTPDVLQSNDNAL